MRVFLAAFFSFFTSLAGATTIFEAMQMEKLHQRNLEKLVQLRLEVQPDLKPNAEDIRRIFRETMSWKELEPEADALLKRNFTEKELAELTKFYSTPTGRKALDIMPRLLADVLEIGRQRTEQEIIKYLDAKAKTKKPGK